MIWKKVADFFTTEAIASYVVALGTAMFWVYKAWKSRQGRHVVCTQSMPAISHLSLSQEASEWLRVEYLDRKECEPVRINALSQILIEIKNDSNTDALQDVELEFLVPYARVLRVWWEECPVYLLDESTLTFVSDSQVQAMTGFPDSSWRVQIFLPQLKSYKKYKEGIVVGFLADGSLETVLMLPQGSKRGVAAEQVWTATFLSFREYQKSVLSRTSRFFSGVLILVILLTVLVTAALANSTEFGFIMVVGIVSGFLLAGLIGFVSQRLRLAQVRLRGI